MNTEVFEELQGAEGGAKAKLEKQARQLAYDTKYKVKQAMAAKSGGKMDPAAVQRAYMAQLAKSPAPPAVKALAKKKLLGEEYVNVDRFAAESVNNVLLKVFAENKQEVVEEVTEEKVLDEAAKEQKFYIKVTDKKTGNTYRRYATRAKIAELRANKNIASVEMTHHGEQSDKEKTKGADTAAVKSGKGLDPVGKEDKDIDNDGDHDKTDKYLLNRRKVRGNAIATRKEEVEIQEVTKMGVHYPHEVPSKNLKGLVKKAVKRIDADNDGDVDTDDPKEKEMGEFVPSPDGKRRIKPIVQKEEFFSDWRNDLFEAESKDKPLDVMKGKNKITVSPEISEKMNLAKADMGDVVKDFYKSDAPQFKGKSKKKRQQMAIAAKLTAERGGRKLGEECGCETCPKCGKSPCECDNGGEDPRGMKTKTDLVKNKMRAMGLKMSYELSGEMLEQAEVDQKKEEKSEKKSQDETLRNIKKVSDKKVKLDREKYMLQRKGKLPLNMSNDLDGEVIEQVTTQTQFKPLPSSGSTGYNSAPSAPTLPPPSANKPKPQVKKPEPHKPNPWGYAIRGNKFSVEDVEVSGEQLDENPIAAGVIRAGLAAGTALAGKVVHDKAKGVVGKLQQRNQKTQQAIDSLRNSYEPEGEQIEERRKEEKVSGKPRNDIGKTDLAYRAVKKTIRDMSGGRPAGQRKKEPGKKPPTAGQYGAPKSPAQKVAQRRAAAQRAQDNMSSRFD